MMVGLQGSGKTTDHGKNRQAASPISSKRKVLMASLDIAPSGGDGAACGARPAGRRRDAADRSRPDAGADCQPRDTGGEAWRLRCRPARYRAAVSRFDEEMMAEAAEVRRTASAA